MTITLMLICGLIVFGLSFVMAQTSGPFGLCGAFRSWVKASSAPTWIKEGVSCIICVSFWVGIPVAWYLANPTIFPDNPDFTTAILLWLTSLGFVCVTTSLSPD